jgi:hypothetical protein
MLWNEVSQLERGRWPKSKLRYIGIFEFFGLDWMVIFQGDPDFCRWLSKIVIFGVNCLTNTYLQKLSNCDVRVRRYSGFQSGGNWIILFFNQTVDLRCIQPQAFEGEIFLNNKINKKITLFIQLFFLNNDANEIFLIFELWIKSKGSIKIDIFFKMQFT